MINVHGLRRNMKNVVKNYSEAQIKVREATSNDPWGPSGTLMSEIADLTYNVVAFSEIMQVLWKRLNDHGKNWKHVYKALVLLEYLLKSGSERVAHQCKENVFAIETLKDFQHVEDNKDQGVNVREKAKHLVSLLKDEERLRNERMRALKARERFALASARTHSEMIEKEFSSKFVDHASLDEDVLSPAAIFVSDLERVRPQTTGEEELQLQLALAMSKEEADQEERIKRNDELRLQMALSESRDSYEQRQLEALQPKNKSSAMDDLLEVFSAQEVATPPPSKDPWGVPVVSQRNSATPPVDGSTTFAGMGGNLNQRSVDSLSSVARSETSSDSFPQASPDYIVSATGNCYNFTRMRKSISADCDIESLSQDSFTQRFLGENANLVNLDALVESTAPAPDPFPPQSANPFHPSRLVQPSINEIRAQNGAAPVTLTRFHPPQFLALNPDSALPSGNAAPPLNPFM